MAVAFDAVGPSSAGATSATTSLTFSHTCGASATHLLVGATLDSNPDGAFSMTATYNTVTMTSLGVWHTGGVTSGFLQIWSLASPATGSAHNVVVTVAGGTPSGINGGSISVTGATGISAVQTASSTGAQTNPVLAFTGSVTGNLVLAFCGAGALLTQSGSFTQRYNVTSGSFQHGAGTVAGATIGGTGGTVTASWTMSADDWSVSAVEAQASAPATTANAGLATATGSADPLNTSGPAYSGAASDLGGGSGSWTNPTNADGAPDSTYATWAVP